MNKIFHSLAKYVALFYNWIPSNYRAGIYGIVSLLITSVSTLLFADLSKVHADNEYGAAFLVAAIGLFHIFVNIIQQKFVELGTKLLAADGNPQVIDNLQTKVAETKSLIASSK